MYHFFSVFSMFFFFLFTVKLFLFLVTLYECLYSGVFFYPSLPKKLYIFFLFFFNLLFLTTFTKSHKYQSVFFFLPFLFCFSVTHFMFNLHFSCIFTNHFIRENRHTLLCFLSYANCFVSLHKKNFKVFFFFFLY